MIDESKKMIRSGDVFQILISNRYYENFDEVDPFSFYRLLRSKIHRLICFLWIIKILF